MNFNKTTLDGVKYADYLKVNDLKHNKLNLITYCAEELNDPHAIDLLKMIKNGTVKVENIFFMDNLALPPERITDFKAAIYFLTALLSGGYEQADRIENIFNDFSDVELSSVINEMRSDFNDEFLNLINYILDLCKSVRLSRTYINGKEEEKNDCEA